MLSIHRRSATRGFALVDVAVSLFIVLATVGGLLGVVFSALKASEANQETARANAAAAEIAESLLQTPFQQVFTTFTSATPPVMPIPGLEPRRNDPDGQVAEVRFPAVQTAGGVELREDVVDEALGMPRDLNGDGAIDSLDHSGDYLILPVHIRLDWEGGGGQRAVQAGLLLTER